MQRDTRRAPGSFQLRLPAQPSQPQQQQCCAPISEGTYWNMFLRDRNKTASERRWNRQNSYNTKTPRVSDTAWTVNDHQIIIQIQIGNTFPLTSLTHLRWALVHEQQPGIWILNPILESRRLPVPSSSSLARAWALGRRRVVSEWNHLTDGMSSFQYSSPFVTLIS